MEKNISTIKEKILLYLDYKGISGNKFYTQTGISNGVLGKKSGLSEDSIDKFLKTYPEVNPSWLFGRGEMLVDAPAEIMVPAMTQKRIPLVNPTAMGGFGSSNFVIHEKDVKDYYVIPKFRGKQIDFMIEVEGLSMFPKYNSGDIVACRIIQESKFIQWNKAHVIGTKYQGIIIKRVKKGESEDDLCMISDNEDYDPFLVPRDEITGMALVVGLIRLE